MTALFLPEFDIGGLRCQSFAAVPANDRIEVETGAVMAVGRGRTNPPKRGGTPLPNDGAIELQLVKLRSHIVILEITVDPPDGVCLAPGQPTASLFVGQ